VAFRYLSGDQHPDHATLAEFRKCHLTALAGLFTQALLLCSKAGLAKDMGHHVPDIQGMMRHSRLATTTDVCMQSLEDGVRSTVNSIYDELSGTGAWGSKAPATARHNHANRKQNDATIAHDKETAGAQKPVRGKVLESATKMLPRQEGRDSLSY
jgi:hypothetical protein